MKMKKNFNDIMKQNLNEEEKWTKPMYNYVGEYNRFENEKLGMNFNKNGRYYTKQTVNVVDDEKKETPQEPKTSDQLDAEREDQELNEKCLDYIKKADDLKRRYKSVVRTAHLKVKKLEKEFKRLNIIVGSREGKKVLADGSDEKLIRRDSERYNEIVKEINELEEDIDTYGKVFEDRLDKLNDSLEEKVKAKLQINGEYVASLRRSLDESFEIQYFDKNLSQYEENLIFGESLSLFNDILILNEGRDSNES